MKKSLIEYLFITLIGLVIFGCAPTQTVKEPKQEPTVEDKEAAQVSYSLGYEYLKQGKYDEASDKFLEAIGLDRKYYAAYIALAQTHRARRDLMAAESTYNRAKSVDPKDPRSYEGLGALYAELKRYSEAITEYQQGLMFDSTNVNLLNGLGYIYSKINEYDKALKHYRKSLEYEPENVTTMFAIAQVYIDRGEPNNAVDYLVSVIEKKPKNIDVRKKLAETLAELKRYDDAVKQYVILIDTEPDNYYYRLQLGLVYQRQKKYANAQKQFEEARRLAPNSATPVFYLADLNIIRANLGAAENLVNEAMKIEPNNLYGNVLLGDIYERRGLQAKNQWAKDKSNKNCNILNNALWNLRTAINYYGKARIDDQFRSYADTEITRCSNWTKELEEDKWFYCRGNKK